MMTQTIPLEMTVDGVLRVGNTRVTLDTIVAAFEGGATAEEIAQQYTSVHLADIYTVIAYYLRQYDEVQEYLKGRKQQAEEVRKQNEARFDTKGLRARLLARANKGK